MIATMNDEIKEHVCQNNGSYVVNKVCMSA